MRNDFNGMAVNLFMGGNQLSSQLEMTPSENCLEGDMEMTVDQQEVYFAMREVTAKNRARVRRAASNAFQIWPDKTLIYKFNPALSKFCFICLFSVFLFFLIGLSPICECFLIDLLTVIFFFIHFWILFAVIAHYLKLCFVLICIHQSSFGHTCSSCCQNHVLDCCIL